jgi:hypothetical protein
VASIRHGRACSGHRAVKLDFVDIFPRQAEKAWMPGTSPGMTTFPSAIDLSQ